MVSKVDMEVVHLMMILGMSPVIKVMDRYTIVIELGEDILNSIIEKLCSLDQPSGHQIQQTWVGEQDLYQLAQMAIHLTL